jgi:Arc/MetJ family transcription regulator
MFEMYISWEVAAMPGTKKVVRKNMRLRQDLIDRAKRILGTSTETETVEQALELVAFRDEVSEGIRRIAGSGSMRDIYAEDA